MRGTVKIWEASLAAGINSFLHIWKLVLSFDEFHGLVDSRMSIFSIIAVLFPELPAEFSWYKTFPLYLRIPLGCSFRSYLASLYR